MRKILTQGENVIVESNSVVELVQPDLFLMLLDFSCEDFKPSSLRFLDRADAFVVIDRGINAPLWEDSGARNVGRQAAVPGEAAALCDGGDCGVCADEGAGTGRKVKLLASGAEPAKFGGSLGKQRGGTGHLLFDGAQMLVRTELRGVRQKVEAVGAGLDISKRLAQVVHQIGKNGFRRRSLG